MAISNAHTRAFFFQQTESAGKRQRRGGVCLDRVLLLKWRNELLNHVSSVRLGAPFKKELTVDGVEKEGIFTPLAIDSARPRVVICDACFLDEPPTGKSRVENTRSVLGEGVIIRLVDASSRYVFEDMEFMPVLDEIVRTKDDEPVRLVKIVTSLLCDGVCTVTCDFE